LAALAASAGCARLFPPRINLERMGTIGLVEFRSEARGEIASYATRIFLEVLLKSQPGARIKELGREADVLRELGAGRFSPDVLTALGRRYGVDSLILGTLDVSNVRPRVDVLSIITTLSVSADVDALLASRLLDLKDGTSGRYRRIVDHRPGQRGQGRVFFDARSRAGLQPSHHDLVRGHAISNGGERPLTEVSSRRASRLFLSFLILEQAALAVTGTDPSPDPVTGTRGNRP
jgi:hypothetical protein